MLTYLLNYNRLDLFLEALKLRFVNCCGFQDDHEFNDAVYERLLIRATTLSQTKRQRINCRWLDQYRWVSRGANGPHARFDIRKAIGDDFSKIGDEVHEAEVILFHDDWAREDRGTDESGSFAIIPREEYMLQTAQAMARITMVGSPWLYGRLCIAMIRYVVEDCQYNNPTVLLNLLLSYEASERIRLGPKLDGPDGNPNRLYYQMRWLHNIISPTRVSTKPSPYNTVILKVYFKSLWARQPPTANAAISVADDILCMPNTNTHNAPTVLNNRLPREAVAERYEGGERLLAALQQYPKNPIGTLTFHGERAALIDYKKELLFHSFSSVEHARWQLDLAERIRVLEEIEERCRPYYEENKAKYDEKRERVCYEIAIWAYRIALAGAYHPGRPKSVGDCPEWALVKQLLKKDWFAEHSLLDSETGLTEDGRDERRLVLEMDEKLGKAYDWVRDLDRRFYVGIPPHVDWQEFQDNRYYDGSVGVRTMEMEETDWVHVARKLSQFQKVVEEQLGDSLRERSMI